MRKTFRRAVTGVGALALAGGLVLASSGVASAATNVGWEPDSDAIGTITLLDSNGVPITGGSLDAQPFAAYAVASHQGRSGIDSKGQLYAFTPQVGTNPQTWSGDVLSAGTYNPAPSGTPADVSGSGLPFVTGGATDFSFNDYISEFPNTLSTAGYVNLYQLRFYTAGTQAPDTTHYDVLDIQVNPSADTWQVVYPSAANGNYPDATDATTTTVSTTPSSPDTSTTNPESVTIKASVSAASAVPASYTGAIGTVSFFDGSTPVGTPQLVSGNGPYTASVSDSVPNPSSHTFSAKFAPYVGTGLASSNGQTQFQVGPPVPGTTTDLAVTPGQYAGDQNNYVATVTYPADTSCTGSVTFYDGTTPVAGPISPKPGTPNEFDATNTFNAPGSHSITAVFTPSDLTVCGGSTSTASTFSQDANPNGPCSTANGGQCTDVQTITTTVPQGVLIISTPYTAQSPLNLGTMTLDSTGTTFTASHTFGGSATDPTQDIFITDTRSGDLPWTAQAEASNLTDGGSNPGSQISGEDVGLTGLTEVPVTGNGFNGLASNFTTFANPAASPAVGPTDIGTQGLGNAAHDIAQAQQGIGSIGLTGTMTVNAPSSTEAGTFTGTVTFTLVGSLV
ncbi:MAG TPA: Ig-like domain-containing protein [Mycobacteriales bacterium]|nr:Ig-like domain-containing protein [Mycobacteriales bacterium]